MDQLAVETQRVGTDARVGVAVGIEMDDNVVDARCIKHWVADNFDHGEDLPIGFLVGAGQRRAQFAGSLLQLLDRESIWPLLRGACGRPKANEERVINERCPAYEMAAPGGVTGSRFPRALQCLVLESRVEGDVRWCEIHLFYKGGGLGGAVFAVHAVVLPFHRKRSLIVDAIEGANNFLKIDIAAP